MSMADLIDFNRMLKEFYGVDNLQKAAIAQSDHIEELQATIHRTAGEISEITDELEELSNGALARFYGTGTHVKFNTTNGLIKFSKARSDAILPENLDIHASGIDLHILEKVKDLNTEVTLYTTGIKVTPPEGYYFMLVGRSSISKSGYSLANGVGIIDENYVGEILVALRKHTEEELVLPNRLVQLVLMPKINCEFTVVDSLEDTARGVGGFGSTG